MKVIDQRPDNTPPEPLTIGNCTPGEVVVTRASPKNFYLVTNISDEFYGINLETGSFLRSREPVTRKVSAVVHITDAV